MKRWEVVDNENRYVYINADYCIPKDDGTLWFGNDDARDKAVPPTKMVVVGAINKEKWQSVKEAEGVSSNKD